MLNRASLIQTLGLRRCSLPAGLQQHPARPKMVRLIADLAEDWRRLDELSPSYQQRSRPWRSRIVPLLRLGLF